MDIITTTIIIILLLIADYYLYKIACLLDKRISELEEETEVVVTGKKYKIISEN